MTSDQVGEIRNINVEHIWFDRIKFKSVALRNVALLSSLVYST